MKKTVLLLFVLLLYKASSAQYNFYRLQAGLGGGLNSAFADVEKRRISQSVSATFDYIVTPFVSFGLEVQHGIISGGDKITDPHLRYFKNSYTSIAANGKISLGHVVNVDLYPRWYKLRGLYAGTGLGIIMNNQKEIVRTQPKADGSPYTFPGKDKSMELMIPAMVGINLDLLTDYWGYPRVLLNFNYQFNVAFGEGMDGYNDPPRIFRNNSPDMVGIATVGIRYTFGPEGIY